MGSCCRRRRVAVVAGLLALALLTPTLASAVPLVMSPGSFFLEPEFPPGPSWTVDLLPADTADATIQLRMTIANPLDVVLAVFRIFPAAPTNEYLAPVANGAGTAPVLTTTSDCGPGSLNEGGLSWSFGAVSGSPPGCAEAGDTWIVTYPNPGPGSNYAFQLDQAPGDPAGQVEIAFSALPEPSTGLLLGLGGLGLIRLSRRRA